MKSLFLKKERVIINNQRKVYCSNGTVAYEIKSNIFQTKLKLFNAHGEVLYYINKRKGLKRKFSVYDLDGNEIFGVKRKYFFYESNKTSIVLNTDKVHDLKVQVIGYQNYLIYIGNEKKLEISKKDKSHHREISIYDLELEDLLVALVFTIILVKEEIDMSN